MSGDVKVYEIERDRHGLMYSGPLEVGECVRVMPVESLEGTFTVYVCPDCAQTTLPPGAFRWRCSKCGCFYATTDERPDERERTPEWWARYSWQYAQPGRPVTMAPVAGFPRERAA